MIKIPFLIYYIRTLIHVHNFSHILNYYRKLKIFLYYKNFKNVQKSTKSVTERYAGFYHMFMEILLKYLYSRL